MTGLFLLNTVLNLCVGFVVGACLHQMEGRRRKAAAKPVETPPVTAPEPSPMELDRQRALDAIESFHKMAGALDQSVEQHTDRVAAINDALRAPGACDDASRVLAASTDLMAANQRLQTELSTARAELEVQRRQLDASMAEARTDGLTGVANRRAFEQELERRFAEWQRRGTPLSLIMLDLDHFKKLNDKHGHQAGDAVLRGVASAVQETSRKTDVVARYGGEEFVVILPGTDTVDGVMAAERIREAIADGQYSHEGVGLGITASIGLAEVKSSDTPATLIQRADMAMYTAKKNGRNCGYYFNGETCEPIQSMTAQERRPALRWMQRIAPGARNTIPAPAAFREVECEDLSSAGMAYFATEPPDYQHLVAHLTVGKDSFYVAAVVRNHRKSDSTKPVYRVACQFLRRITPVAPLIPTGAVDVAASGVAVG